MINFSRYKVILWDFDGVLMDSMPIRDKGFEIVLSSYPKEQVSSLMDYHRRNGGLSRYHKFTYFFETIRGEAVTQDRILELAALFSEIMLQNLVDSTLLIQDSLDFVKANVKKMDMHIVSGSDQTELREICRQLGLTDYFQSIQGSPETKTNLIKGILDDYTLIRESVVYIGDAMNDFYAAQTNGIGFLGYNNSHLQAYGNGYIESFTRYRNNS